MTTYPLLAIRADEVLIPEQKIALVMILSALADLSSSSQKWRSRAREFFRSRHFERLADGLRLGDDARKPWRLAWPKNCTAPGCNRFLVYAGRGRPRKYCCPACCQKAYRARLQAA